MTTPEASKALADECWHDLIEKDDRNSPEEYPEMALISKEELAGYLARSQPGTLAREEVQSVINEMIEVATHEDDSIMTEWISDNRADIDKWQCRLSDAIALTPSHEAGTQQGVKNGQDHHVDRNDRTGSYSVGEATHVEAGTQEPVADNEPKLPCDLFVGSVRFHKGVKIETVRLAAQRWYQAATEQFAAPASQDATREVLELAADAIDAARYAHPDHPRERPHPFAKAHKTDREYAFRLARAALASRADRAVTADEGAKS